jgi:VanZ family protein
MSSRHPAGQRSAGQHVAEQSSGRGRRWGLPQLLVVLAVVAVATHLYGLYRPAGPPSPGWFPQVDKAEHLLGFAAPVCLVLLARAHLVGRASTRTQIVVVGLFAGHAVLSELVQHQFLTGRTGDPVDVLADWAGVALGWLVARLLSRRRGSSVVPAGETPTATAR